MENFFEVGKKMLLRDLPHDGVFVDCTLTDGYDTLYMAKFVSEGNVVSFARCREEIDGAYKLIEDNFQDNAHIILDNPVNMQKYVTGEINGFMLNNVESGYDDDNVIRTINMALSIMKRHMRGMVIINAKNVSVKKFLEEMPKDKVSVVSISMANIPSPLVYIIEKRSNY